MSHSAVHQDIDGHVVKRVPQIYLVLACCFGLLPSDMALAQTFGGFQAMEFPQESLQIGAKFISGAGTSGQGAAVENLITSKGPSSAVINTQTKARVLASLSRFLGVDASLITQSNSAFSDLTITGVMDFAKLDNVAAGDRVLARAIRAGKISIVTTEGGAADIEAKATARGLPVAISATSAGLRNVSIDGSSLFVAYQVVEFSSAQPRTKMVRHKGRNITVDGTWRVSFKPLEGKRNFDDGAALIEVANLKQPTLAGSFRSSTINYVATRDFDKQFPLPPSSNGSTMTAGYIQIWYRPTCSSYDTPLCLVVFPRSQNKVVVTTSRFDIKPVRNPIGL